MAHPSLHYPRFPQSIFVYGLLRGVLYGQLAGAISGAVYGTIQFPIVGTVVGACIGSAAGIIAGLLGGLIFALVTRSLFMPLLNSARYRITIGILSLTANPIMIFAASLLAQAPLRWYDDNLLFFLFLPASISECAALIVGQILAQWYVTTFPPRWYGAGDIIVQRSDLSETTR